MNKSIIIVGAGIAGLSAGCYAQMNGYDAMIFEMHGLPGGLCTAWDRKGYRFDGCIHFLVGTNPMSPLNTVWKEVGALEGTPIVNHDVYMEIRGNGRQLILYTDADRLEAHMSALSPTDGELARELCDAIRNYSLTGGGAPGRLGKTAMRDFAAEFHDPFLREALCTFHDMNFFLMTMSAYHRRDAGWPEGGSLAFALAIERRFLALGGRIRYRAKVGEILTDGNRATGVRLADGSCEYADDVISTADGHETVFGMLGGRHLSGEAEALYTRGAVYPTSVQISVGVGCDLSQEPHSLFTRLDRPISIAGAVKPGLLIEHYCYDQSLCPPGKSIVTSTVYSSHAYWKALADRGRDAYLQAKSDAADAFIDALGAVYPQTRGKAEVSDVATPLTYSRYTGAWNGSYMGWMSTPEFPVARAVSVLPGLEHLYMAGQWAAARGGLPAALMTARNTVMRICQRDGKEYITKL